MTDERGPRELWALFEPYHALTYYAPEGQREFERIGLRGFWRGYFAGRAAPLGPVGAGVVTACFYGFHPAFVARALPSIWTIADPDAALAARLAGVDRAVRRLYPDVIAGPVFEETSRLLRHALESCTGPGRPLYSANRELDWPEEPHLALWHAATLAREHRGDGHVAALTVNGVGPCAAHVLRVAADGIPPETIQPYRGWSADDWTSAIGQLRDREWLDSDHGLTATGSAVRDEVEAMTDRLAGELLAPLSNADYERLLDGLRLVTGRLVQAGEIPYPNPIGVPPPLQSLPLDL
jgi:hypothetical protein